LTRNYLLLIKIINYFVNQKIPSLSKSLHEFVLFACNWISSHGFLDDSRYRGCARRHCVSPRLVASKLKHPPARLTSRLEVKRRLSCKVKSGRHGDVAAGRRLAKVESRLRKLWLLNEGKI
jgi:hypothetical protein